ncbi:hypothetical protein I4F81_002118 [Pyropia yezoensis]|uniref:Uncharacterized protein n=1 Tax=Pyropia yezoensis TaxID=2788 RepID=A0ACC3BNM9_PYRYE|nr:hypothetical protein I4F81_002118 [Neopyropia yezoensis]
MDSTVRAALSPKLDAPPPPPSTAPRRPLTAAENLSVGATAGAIEITIQQPTIALKNAMQTGAPLPRSIPALYRGLGVNVVSIAPITAVQFSLTAALTAVVLSRRPALPAWLYGPQAPVPEPTGAPPVTSAAGDASAPPRQAKALSLPAAARALAASAAVRGVTHPWRGFWATAGRDALYTAAYMGVAGSGAGLGLLGGIGGVVPRAGRIGGAVAILGGVKGVLEDLVIDYRG